MGGESPLAAERRAAEKEVWDAYWKVREIDSRGTFHARAKYFFHRAFDAPATWFREKIVQPLHAKNKMPYYHRELSRVPDIDQCGVNDKACYFEANEQFRLDKMVDGFILQVLRQRLDRCMLYNNPNFTPCIKPIEDMEESELNFFINEGEVVDLRYGEIGGEGDVRDAYMKQKHRLIWERRNPEIMEERKRLYQEHKEKLAKGDLDYSFWKQGTFFQDKKNYEPPYEYHLSKPTLEGDKPLSKDWQYYKKMTEDEEFAKEENKEHKFPLF